MTSPEPYGVYNQRELDFVEQLIRADRIRAAHYRSLESQPEDMDLS